MSGMQVAREHLCTRTCKKFLHFPTEIVDCDGYDVSLRHCRHLARLFPRLDLDLGLVQQLLTSLEFCLPVDPHVLKVDLSKLTQTESKEATRWLFFPASSLQNLLSSPQKMAPQQSAHYLSWQLRTSKKHSISACVLQTVVLRLAAHFVVKQCDEEGVVQLCCSIWQNGITWQSATGVDVLSIYITNNRVIQVIGASSTSANQSHKSRKSIKETRGSFQCMHQQIKVVLS